MEIKPEFAIREIEAARQLVRDHPFGLFVSADLRVTRMPCLLDDDAPGLAILSHVARADPMAERLDGPLLAVFSGPHGYISASWYESDTIPTWNHVTLQLRGVPECFDDSLPLVRRTVDHFEAAMPDPWSLDRMGQTAREMADEVIAFRIEAAGWHLEAKLSQDKPADERARVLDGLATAGPYANPALIKAMRS
jgi:transcriptional regulator